METGLGGAPSTGGQGTKRPAAPAELRVRALRDAVRDAVAFLQSQEPISLREFHNDLLTACASIEDNDLGSDGVTIGQQFEAFFERLRGLMDAHTEPVPTNSLGLPADAQFLSAMAEYLTSSYVLDGEE